MCIRDSRHAEDLLGLRQVDADRLFEQTQPGVREHFSADVAHRQFVDGDDDRVGLRLALQGLDAVAHLRTVQALSLIHI